MRILTFLFLLLYVKICSAQNFSSFEYFFNNDPGIGNGTTITNVPAGSDITFSPNITIPPNLNPGLHVLYIRSKTPSGNDNLLNRWSITKSIPIIVTSQNTGNASTITEIEYFFDNDPGLGAATKVAFVNNGND